MAKSKTDAHMIARLKREAPEVLEAEVDFDALFTRIITVDLAGVGVAPKRRNPISKQHTAKQHPKSR
jgi:hypothetical protein